MKKINILILTDHSNHSSENALYAFAHTMQQQAFCGQLDIATRGIAQNNTFFKNKVANTLQAIRVNQQFNFNTKETFFAEKLIAVNPANYDLIWLRLPPPLSPGFLNFLDQSFPNQCIINAPKGIDTTGSKEFLMNFPTLCPPMKVCKNLEDIIAFKKQFPIVLKPFREYGGRGIVRIDDDQVWLGKQEITFQQFATQYAANPVDYLGVQFLKNVSQGDKRIVVVNGKILGASLRLPAKNSWLCNVAMGGSSNIAEADDDEQHIVATLNPVLTKMGIVMYGVDTLVGNDGKRVLSEINTTSIGGLPQIAKLQNKPLVAEAMQLIRKYYEKNKI